MNLKQGTNHSRSLRSGVTTIDTSNWGKSSESSLLQKQSQISMSNLIRKDSSSIRDDSAIDLAMSQMSGGTFLSQDILSQMEQRLKIRLPGVKIHTDKIAEEIAKKMMADAFTLRDHIFFGKDKYSPSSEAGLRLMLHELAHVVQFRQGRIPAGNYEISNPTDALELEASAMCAKEGEVECVDIGESYANENGSNMILRSPSQSEIEDEEIVVEAIEVNSDWIGIIGTPHGIQIDVSWSIVQRQNPEYQWDGESIPRSTFFLQPMFVAELLNRFLGVAVTANGIEILRSNGGIAVSFNDYLYSADVNESYLISLIGRAQWNEYLRRESSSQLNNLNLSADVVSEVEMESADSTESCLNGSRGVMTFPYRGTRFGGAPISARRDGDCIVVKQPVYVAGNTDFSEQTATLPDSVFISGVRIRPDQIVRVHVYRPQWYNLNITGSAQSDEEHEFCVTGEQMLQFSEASTDDTINNIAFTAVDAASLFVPIGRALSISKNSLAASMIALAEATSPQVVERVVARAAVVVVEEQTAIHVADQAIARSVSQTIFRTSEQATSQALSSAATIASGSAGPASAASRLAVAELVGSAVRSAQGEAFVNEMESSIDSIASSNSQRMYATGERSPGGVESAPSSAIAESSSSAPARLTIASNDTLIVDSQVARALEQGASGTIPEDQAILPLAYEEALSSLSQLHGQAATVTPTTLRELTRNHRINSMVQILRTPVVSTAQQRAVLNRLIELNVGGASSHRDRRIVLEALVSPRVQGSTPIFMSADRRVINGLAKAANINSAELGRYQNVAEYLYYERNATRFYVDIEGYSLIVHPVQVVRNLPVH